MDRKSSGRTDKHVMAIGLKWYLEAVGVTTRWVVDEGAAPPWDPDRGLIALTWHGRQFLSHTALRRHPRRSLLASPHRDGTLIGAAARKAGFDVIIGSGSTNRLRTTAKRGAPAFRSMLKHLRDERAIVATADIPKVARVAGAGPIKLAQISGAPIYCFAAVTKHRLELHNWDRTHVVFPFGRGAILWSDAIRVPRDASPGELEEARLAVQATLNWLHRRADRIVNTKTLFTGRID